VATCLVLLPSSFVVRSLQIAADMRLVNASLGGKIPAASCQPNLSPPPYALCPANWAFLTFQSSPKRKSAGSMEYFALYASNALLPMIRRRCGSRASSKMASARFCGVAPWRAIPQFSSAMTRSISEPFGTAAKIGRLRTRSRHACNFISRLNH